MTLLAIMMKQKSASGSNLDNTDARSVKISIAVGTQVMMILPHGYFICRGRGLSQARLETCNVKRLRAYCPSELRASELYFLYRRRMWHDRRDHRFDSA